MITTCKNNIGFFFPNVFNIDHNVLELYNVSVEIRLTTSKTKRGI